MDQDSFRRLLESGSGGSKQSQRSRGSLLVAGTATSTRKTVDASEPAFKPRKVKKSEGKYRDRAAERRVGEGNDYAQVEAVLEDFEKRLGDNNATDEERKYLGGDSDHSILVKGLDFALLEQNKAKASLSTVDDDSLEQAFMAVASETTVPKKRTREELLRELKEKRGIKSNTATTPDSKPNDDAIEAAKKQGKFKPIGFKPIGGVAEKPKRKKAKGDGVEGERKKKKRKVEGAVEKGEAGETSSLLPPPPLPSDPAPTASSSTLVPPEDDMPDDFDIFAGAGEYEGIDLGDEEDDDEPPAVEPDKPELEDGEEFTDAPPLRKWFEDDEPEPLSSSSKLPLAPVNVKPPVHSADDDEEGELEQPTRLVPLASSALPSIKDLLAMDKAANSSDKWKKRKDKKKSGKDEGDTTSKPKMTAEVKVERDYKRLKNYTDKKAAGSMQE
ncbi:RED-like protein N-terminal region-domain-containing protein [Mycena latifolia]|nr:RED-like protein N-terminal region-domain-containing protein [Mycena latifolia]